MTITHSRWVRRCAALVGAVLFVGIITVSIEQARPTATVLDRVIGVEPVEERLAAIADTIAVAHRRPSAADLTFANRIAARQPLAALPYYIAAATRGPAAMENARALNALALQRDPRLRPAWAWRVNDRAQAADVAGTTRALIRLAVLNQEAGPIWSAIAQITTDPAARKEIKAEIARGAVWRDDYLTHLTASKVDPAIVFEMLAAAGKQASVTSVAPPSGAPDDRRAFLTQLVTQHDYERAYLAWVQWLPAGSRAAVGNVFDGDFKGAAALPPFAWDIANGGGGTASIDPAVGLSIDYSGSDGSVLANQMVLLAPGRYRLVTRAKFQPVSNEYGAAPLTWTLVCITGNPVLNELPVPVDGSAKRVAGVPFEVAKGCDAQTLSLKVNSADFAKHLVGAIRSVAIETVK